MITKEQLAERYKNIVIERQGDILVVRLYQNENTDDKIYFVRLIFADNKLFYSGDMGAYTFGQNIVHIFRFFKGDGINTGYWMEKLEAKCMPVYPHEVDLDKLVENVKNNVMEYYNVDCYDDLDDEVKEQIEDALDWMDSNDIRAFDRINELYENLDFSDPWYYASDTIESSKTISPNYVYACEVIQWVENNLYDWCKERNINLEELDK